MRPAFFTTMFSGLILATIAAAEEKREADAHEHGHGSFNMAIEGETVVIEFEAPSFDILGFEHQASSDAEKKAVEQARDDFANPIALFGLPESAGCRVSDIEIEIGAEADHHDDEDHDDHHEEAHHEDEHHDEDHHEEDAHHDEDGADHSEVHAHYVLTCEASSEITAINASAYFEAFSNAEEVDAAVLSDVGQASGELEADSPELTFSN